MLRMLERVESIHDTQPGCSLEYKRYIHDLYINILFSLRQGLYKQIVTTHYYMMVCIRTSKNVRCKIKIRDTLTSQRWFVQAKVLLSLSKQIGVPSE